MAGNEIKASLQCNDERLNSSIIIYYDLIGIKRQFNPIGIEFPLVAGAVGCVEAILWR